MAGRGPAPKNQRSRERDNRPEVLIEASERASNAPPLPDRDTYRIRTQKWYDLWAASPQAARFTATDWQRLHFLADLVDLYDEAPTKELMAEIRLNEERLGATLLDRKRIGIRVVDEPAAEAAKSRHPARSGRDPRLSVVKGA